ncbi:helicase-exonuclease AddAB subunit AddA [Paenibacillus pini]|uniref:ATP-dependent helicase/nuclease subunit A n=1 Tax=Paenibacillus pini JCM 16418 TaxID=1236976 RepID=W7YET0_9BACL|nr:helicase-exonuclease AddAB subunit AddA [Paenibacillus pini]GAF07022.1 ATP-dependent nuclease [Paenibacillus pini JCM 16418]
MIEAAKPVGSMWSDDQWQAISQYGDDILVAAAAGSGKTAVLVERIIRKIMNEEQGFSVDRLLVATFTKAAAAEMRERIREALDKELEKNPEHEHLRRQLSMLGRASITTLHSFCLEVIRRYYQMIPLDPGFRIINENEAELLRQEILEELFEEKYGQETDDSTFIKLVDWFSGERSDDAVYALVQKLYDFSRSHPWPDEWLRNMATAFSVKDTADLSRTAWVKSILQDARLALAGAVALLEQAHQVAMMPGGPGPYVDNLNADLDMVRGLQDALEHRQWDELFPVFQNAAFGKLKSCRKDETDPIMQERVKELRESVKKTVNDLKGALFGRPAETFLVELHEAAPLMQELSSIVILFGERYQMEKRRRGTVDFSDLEHYCLQILRDPASTPDRVIPSDAAMEYRAQFDEVLLDEYQDTNSVQENIVRLISREQPGNRFMVGDVKQSIYRFRLAEPGLFLDKYRRYALEQTEGVRIDLARNFRSRLEVVNAVNVLFRQLMNETVAEINYDKRAELVYGASFPIKEIKEGFIPEQTYTPELVLIERAHEDQLSADDSSESDTGSSGLMQESEVVEMETAQIEARAIARKIRSMMGETTAEPFMVYDKGLQAMRPVRYGDMVILLRSAYLWGPLILEELRQLGIPADGEQNKGYFQATEVEIMLSLLQIIDNPQQDIPLAGVLRSPVVGLSEEELAQIRLCSGGSFYEAMLAAIQQLHSVSNVKAFKGDNEHVGESVEASELHYIKESIELAQQEAVATAESERTSSLTPDISEGDFTGVSSLLRDKITAFLEQLEGWRNAARQGSLGDLIWRVYRETGYLDWVGGLPGGGQRQGNLKALHDRAVQFEQTTASRGLFRFLTFVARLRDRGSDLGGPSGTQQKDNAVRIMTIHKSKGLEFPVVFIAGMSKQFNQQDLNSSFLIHKELGFGPKFVDQLHRVSYPTLANLAIRRRSQLELLAEELRVLYVGLTRPKEKLILIGSVKDLPKKISSWAQIQQEQQYLLPDYILARGRSYLDWVGPALIRHPDAWLLREINGSEEGVSTVLESDPSSWNISVWSGDDLSLATLGGWEDSEESTPERRTILQAMKSRLPIVTGTSNHQSALESQVNSQLSWQYPFAAASRLSAKTSVTEMKKLISLQEQPALDWVEESIMREEMTVKGGKTSPEHTLQLRRPKFMEQKAMSPTERGTVYHTVMQHIPLDQGTVDTAVVEQTIQYLTEREMITREQANMIKQPEVQLFYESDIGKRLLNAEWVLREMPFSYGLTAEDAYKGLMMLNATDMPSESMPSTEETVLIQGVVDCLFRLEDKLILVDYKTDRVLEQRGGIEVLTEQYRFQLELYSKALSDILGEEISEKWLYFFDGGHVSRL